MCDGYTDMKPIDEHKTSTELIRALEERFLLRQLLIGEQIELLNTKMKEKMGAHFYLPMSKPTTSRIAIAERMMWHTDTLIDKVKNNSSKIDAVLKIVQQNIDRDGYYKAVVVTESAGAAEYIRKHSRPCDSISLPLEAATLRVA